MGKKILAEKGEQPTPEEVQALAGTRTSEELDALSCGCHRPARHGHELPEDGRIVFATSTLRTLARYEWLEPVVFQPQVLQLAPPSLGLSDNPPPFQATLLLRLHFAA
jgi:hypothetical protein